MKFIYAGASVAVIAATLGGIADRAYAQTPTKPAAQSDVTVSEIIVTAQRREESAQKTPMVINLLSGKDLLESGATNVTRIADLVPGVSVVTSSLNGAQVAVRGIVNVNANVGSDPSLATSVDDVYIARSQAAMASFYDVARIELLKGPQGTLYGRNSISGAMNIITNDPSHVLDGYANLEVGNYDTVKVEGALNIPIGEKVAVRLSGQYAKRDGYIDNYWNDQDDKGGRAKVLVELSDTARVVAFVSYSTLGGVGSLNPLYPFRGSDAWHPNDATRRTAKLDNTVLTVGAKFTWEVGPGTLTYIRGYTRFTEDYIGPLVGGLTRSDRTTRSSQQTDEVRYASTSAADAKGQFSWVVGGFWYREDQSQFRITEGRLPIGQLVQNAGYPHVYAGSLAAFGQGTYAVTDDTRVTLGLRYTTESKEANGSNETTLNGRFTSVPTEFEQSDKAVTYRVGIEQDLSPTSLLYASVSSGFHGGGWQDGSGPTDSTYKPEKITSYEVGSKNEFFGRRLRSNIGFYYYDYTDFLVAVNNVRAPTCACYVNAAKAWTYGLEWDNELAITRDDRVGLTLAYQDSEYTDFRIYQPFTSTVPGGKVIPATATTPAGQDFSGTQFSYVSKFSGTFRYTHDFRLANGGNIQAGVNSSFRTSYNGTLGFNPLYRLSGYTKTDVNLTYRDPKGWSLGAFARNLEKSPAIIYLQPEIGGGANLRAGIGAPRTYGIRASARF